MASYLSERDEVIVLKNERIKEVGDATSILSHNSSTS